MESGLDKNDFLRHDFMQNLRRIYTSGFRMRFPHCVAIFYNLPWLSKTKVIYRNTIR